MNMLNSLSMKVAATVLAMILMSMGHSGRPVVREVVKVQKKVEVSA